MNKALQASVGASPPASTAKFIPLALETREKVDTAAAAYHLLRKPQTMRIWACRENGPLRPTRIHGRLAWAVADIRRLLGVA
jgi:hypothetical protein